MGRIYRLKGSDKQMSILTMQTRHESNKKTEEDFGTDASG